jgi:DmsE family decaheme c-type cytochrome
MDTNKSFKESEKINDVSIYMIRRYALQRNNMKPIRWFGLMGIAVFMFFFIQAAPVSATPAEGGSEEFQTCAECHEDLAAGFVKSAHAVIDKRGLAGHTGAKSSCAACHGKVDKYLEEAEAGNIFAFKAKDTANDISKRCLNCHMDNHGNYFASAHAKASLACTQCHTIHGKSKGDLLKGHAVKMCISCHQDVYAKFKLNERHRLQEGIVTCSSCHDHHGPALRERLGGFKQETCYKCHTDKQGPFLYEHASVHVEGCSTCHDVHGSPNRHLLINQSVSELCYSCHTMVPGWHSRFTQESNCANCHSTIHGSNFSSKFLK